MKKNSLGMKLWAALMALLVVGYFGVQAYRYFNDPLSTTLVYSYQVEEDVTLSGWVVRTEQLLPSGGGGIVELRREEGERVSVGGEVAEIFTDQTTLDIRQQVEILTDQLEQLRYARETAATPEAALKLDAQIEQSILDYRRYVAAGQFSKAETQGRELRALVMKRDYSALENEDVEAQIQQIERRIGSLNTQTVDSVRRIVSPKSGLFSAVVDGYEGILTPEVLKTLKPSQLDDLVKTPAAPGSDVGKLVLGDVWYYVAVMPAEEAEDLAEWSAALVKKRQTLTLRFAKSVERDLPVVVDSVGAEEDGQCVVVFRGTKYLAQLTLLRHQSAQVVSRVYEGVRVPKSALRIIATKETAADGTEKTVQTIGLYCVVGMEARFKPVEILYSGDGFVLVQPAASVTAEALKIRNGDEVIIAARDLYDGKVIGG